jgi:hypothetical protein
MYNEQLAIGKNVRIPEHQMKHSWRRIATTSGMKMTYHSLTACVPASGAACEDARRSTERRSIYK